MPLIPGAVCNAIPFASDISIVLADVELDVNCPFTVNVYAPEGGATVELKGG